MALELFFVSARTNKRHHHHHHAQVSHLDDFCPWRAPVQKCTHSLVPRDCKKLTFLILSYMRHRATLRTPRDSDGRISLTHIHALALSRLPLGAPAGIISPVALCQHHPGKLCSDLLIRVCVNHRFRYCTQHILSSLRYPVLIVIQVIANSFPQPAPTSAILGACQ